MTADRPGRWVLEPSEPNAPPTLRFVADGDTPPDPNVIRIGSAGITLGVAGEIDLGPARDEWELHRQALALAWDEGHTANEDLRIANPYRQVDQLPDPWSPQPGVTDAPTEDIRPSWDEWEAAHQKIIDLQARLAVLEEDRNAWQMAADGYRAMFDKRCKEKP